MTLMILASQDPDYWGCATPKPFHASKIRHPVPWVQMSSLWPRIEPLLARVEKPARYIGMEQGAVSPRHRPDDVSWLLVYPDTYEVGLPNQGRQILYEILNERDDAVAERSYAPWFDMEEELRRAGVPLF